MTLIVQGGNFVITYLVLSRLFFRPAAACVQSEDQTLDDAQLAVTHELQRVHDKESTNTDVIKKQRQQLAQRMPESVEAVTSMIPHKLAWPDLEPLSAQQESDLVKKIGRLVVNRVSGDS